MLTRERVMSLIKKFQLLTKNHLFIIWPLSIIFSLNLSFAAEEKVFNIDIQKFAKPHCFIGQGDHSASFKKKYKTLKRYQKRISRKKSSFRRNKKAEMKTRLRGTPNWIVEKSLKAKGYSKDEIEFAYFTMTLFAEARNSSEKDIEMVAKVINNRRKNKSYQQTVTKLAQFSSWYYKSQRDNVVMLCPSPIYFKHWGKIVKVAINHFYETNVHFKSTHYFAPYNMVPRYRIPTWAKGKYGVVYGGHIFLVKKGYVSPEGLTAKYIPRKSKSIIIRGGKFRTLKSRQNRVALAK